jgi:putative transposon-encoded protein
MKEENEDIFEKKYVKQIEKFGTGSHIILPKEHIGKETQVYILKDQTFKKILNELTELNKNLNQIPNKYLNILTQCIGGNRLISLDFTEVKKIVKNKKITYDYVDFKVDSTTNFINILKSKFKNNQIMIIYILNQESGNLNKYNSEISRLKEIPFYTYGTIINEIIQPKILIIGTK